MSFDAARVVLHIYRGARPVVTGDRTPACSAAWDAGIVAVVKPVRDAAVWLPLARG
jgi:hypothetical protein